MVLISLLVHPGEDPYAEFYYPNTTRRIKATNLTIGVNQKLTGLKLALPPRLSERTVEGVAVWPDGRLAVNVAIELHNPKTGYGEGNPVWTDSQGHFTIAGLDGQTYELSAPVNKGIPLVNSKPIIVKLEQSIRPVKLVIVVP